MCGAPDEHAEHWKAPEIVESALKYMALIFRKTFNSNNKRDVLQRGLKEVVHSMRPIIEGQTRVNVGCQVVSITKRELLQVYKPWR